MITEEFSFPVISSNNAAVNLALLPPLWRISSINNNHSLDADASELEQENINGRWTKRKKIFTSSFSGELMVKNNINEEAAAISEKDEKEAQEKMDVLWEDFNEELRSTCTATINDSFSDSDFSEDNTANFRNHHNYNNINATSTVISREEFGRIQVEECGRSTTVRELKLMIPAKRRKLELVVNMMKKLFLLHNAAAAKNKKRGPN